MRKTSTILDANLEELDASTGGPQQRLLMAALRLFAEKGFANTSIRDLAQAAKVNISAISYYFGDKKGLYNAAFTQTLQCGGHEVKMFQNLQASDQLSLDDFLRKLLQGFVEPLKLGAIAVWRVRLQMREMIEPTGLWDHEIQFKIAPILSALESRLVKEFNISQVDDAIKRLAFSIMGLGVHVMVSRDVMTQLLPDLMNSESAIDTYAEQLVFFALAMIEAEKKSLLKSV
jgi:AcrR family transcriptional regulator